jgi:hypothetical protein
MKEVIEVSGHVNGLKAGYLLIGSDCRNIALRVRLSIP